MPRERSSPVWIEVKGLFGSAVSTLVRFTSNSASEAVTGSVGAWYLTPTSFVSPFSGLNGCWVALLVPRIGLNDVP